MEFTDFGHVVFGGNGGFLESWMDGWMDGPRPNWIRVRKSSAQLGGDRISHGSEFTLTVHTRWWNRRTVKQWMGVEQRHFALCLEW